MDSKRCTLFRNPQFTVSPGYCHESRNSYEGRVSILSSGTVPAACLQTTTMCVFTAQLVIWNSSYERMLASSDSECMVEGEWMTTNDLLLL